VVRKMLDLLHKKCKLKYFRGQMPKNANVICESSLVGYKKVLTWGRGLSKIAKKVLTYFMDGPLAGRQLGKHN